MFNKLNYYTPFLSTTHKIAMLISRHFKLPSNISFHRSDMKMECLLGKIIRSKARKYILLVSSLITCAANKSLIFLDDTQTSPRSMGALSDGLYASHKMRRDSLHKIVTACSLMESGFYGITREV